MLDAGQTLMLRSTFGVFVGQMEWGPQSEFILIVSHQFNFFGSNIRRATRIDEEEFLSVISFAMYEGHE